MQLDNVRRPGQRVSRRVDDECEADARLGHSGRGEAFKSHANAVCKAFVSLREIAMRDLKGAESLYPFTDKEQIAVKQGECVYAHAKSIEPVYQKGGDGFNLSVFPSVNGLNPLVHKLKFIGIARIKRAQDSLSENGVSVNMSGVDTTLYTGTQFVGPHVKLRFDWPKVIKVNGRRTPLVEPDYCPGKFLPSMLPAFLDTPDLQIEDFTSKFCKVLHEFVLDSELGIGDIADIPQCNQDDIARIRNGFAAKWRDDDDRLRNAQDYFGTRLKLTDYSYFSNEADIRQQLCPMTKYYHLLLDFVGLLGDNVNKRVKQFELLGNDEIYLKHMDSITGETRSKTNERKRYFKDLVDNSTRKQRAQHWNFFSVACESNSYATAQAKLAESTYIGKTIEEAHPQKGVTLLIKAG